MVAENSESDLASRQPIQPTSASEKPDDAPAEQPESVADELPEFEELTPEYLEDECIRGDFMLRWASILLGVLFGWLLITETPVLVSIRTGEYLLSHGILPPRVDVFSATAEGRPWVNLHWLSDLLLAGVHNLLGMPGLTILAALTVGLSMWVLARITWPNVTTWWGSFCAVLALIAFFPIIQPGETTVTILGLALLGGILARSQTDPESKGDWQLIPLMILWTNLDSRCWIGMMALLLFLIGELIARNFRSEASKKRIMMQVGALLGGLLINPWPLQSALQFRNVLLENEEAVAYQGLREFFPRLDFTLIQPEFWFTLDLFSGVALALAVTALVTLLLNVKRAHPGWWLVWLGVNLLSLVWGESLCYAAILNTVIATLNGQDWCRHQFKMDFAVTSLNVLWSRAGRAAMVLGIFLLAYLAINGALMGSQGRRVGTGLDPRWTARIDSLEEHVLPGAFTDRIFPTTPSQGDVLIWAGKKPFVDSRFALYRSGGEDLLKLHREIRAELFSPTPAVIPNEAEQQAAKSQWKESLAKFQVPNILVRLWSPRPPYIQFFRLDANPAWTLTGLGSAGAVLTRSDLDTPELKVHLEKFSLSDFAKLAFRPANPVTPDTLQGTWPLPASRYDNWLVQKLNVPSPSAELAAHYLALLTESGRRLTQDQAAGLGFLAIRNARRGLEETPNHPLPYRVIGKACLIMQQVELQMSGINLPQSRIDFYDTQILSSAYSSAIASQENPGDLLELFQIQMSRRLIDAALDTLNRYDRVMSRQPGVEIAPEMQAELKRIRGDLEQTVKDVTSKIEEAKSQNRPLIEQAAIATGGGCPRLALALLEEDLTKPTSDPELQLFYATLLLQSGRLENAVEQVETLGMRINGPQGANVPPLFKSQWRSIARTVHLSTNNLEEYIKLSAEDLENYWISAIKPLLQVPFGSMQIPLQMELWPAYLTAITVESGIELPERWGTQLFSIARADLARGDLPTARDRLQRLIQLNPRFSFAAVASKYLASLTGTAPATHVENSSIPDWIKNFETESSLRKKEQKSEDKKD